MLLADSLELVYVFCGSLCNILYVLNSVERGCIIWRNVDVAARDLEGLSTWHHVRSGWRLPNGGIEIDQSEPEDSGKFTRKRLGFPHIRRGAPGLSTQSPSEEEDVATRVEYALENATTVVCCHLKSSTPWRFERTPSLSEEEQAAPT